MKIMEDISLATFSESQTLPCIIQSKKSGLDLINWARKNRELIEEKIGIHGAILFRNFATLDTTAFEELIKVMYGSTFNNIEESSPRSKISGNVYTSTDYPPDEAIFLHNENSYMDVFPLKLFFYCVTPARAGGETPLADCRTIYQNIDPGIREKFAQKKWMYVRNYGSGIGMSWEQAFQTKDRTVVEKYCNSADIQFEWKGDALKTRQVREAFLKHPRTEDLSWFNHLTFFHISTLEPAIREGLLSIFEEEDLPNNTYYGDGSPIEESVMDEIRNAYTRNSISFSWAKGDLVILDNMLTAHSRTPFQGERKLMFAQADPIARREIFKK